VPRNFKLLDELESAEKSSKGGADISLGLARPDDTFMTGWNASIFTTAGRGGEPRIFFVALQCDDSYPKSAPTIRFTSKVALDCVDATGRVRRHRRSRRCPTMPWRRVVQRCAGGSCVARCRSTMPCARFGPPRPAPQVLKDKLPYLATWTASKNMYGALAELKTMISSAPRAQPPDGAHY